MDLQNHSWPSQVCLFAASETAIKSSFDPNPSLHLPVLDPGGGWGQKDVLAATLKSAVLLLSLGAVTFPEQALLFVFFPQKRDARGSELRLGHEEQPAAALLLGLFLRWAPVLA